MSKSRKSAFTKLPNELLEEICRSPFNGTECAVLLAVVRKNLRLAQTGGSDFSVPICQANLPRKEKHPKCA